MGGKLVSVVEMVWSGGLETEVEGALVQIELEVDQQGRIRALEVLPDGSKRDVELVVRRK